VYIAGACKVAIAVVLFWVFPQRQSNVFSFRARIKKNNIRYKNIHLHFPRARAHFTNMTKQEQKQQQSEDAGVVSASVQKAAEVIKDKVDQTASKVEEQLSGGGGSEKAAGEAGNNKGGLRGMMGKLKEKLSLKRKKSSSSSSSSASLTVATNPTTRPQIPICGSGNKRRQ